MKKSQVEEVVSKLNYADWLVLYYLAAVMNKENFAALIKNLAEGGIPEYKGQNSDNRWWAKRAAEEEGLMNGGSEDGADSPDATLKSPARLQHKESIPMKIKRTLSNKSQS